MDAVEAVVEVGRVIIGAVVVVAQAISNVRAGSYGAVAIIDVCEKVVRYGVVPLFSNFYGTDDGVMHPDVGDDYH